MKLNFSKSVFFDNIIRKLFFLTALTCILVLMMIIIFLLKEGLPILNHVSLSEFLTGREWYPASDPPLFGTFPLIMSSLAVTLISAFLSVPLSIAVAVYISEISGKKTREIIKPAIELIASLPSVVLGFFGMVVIAPFLQKVFDIDTGLNMFNASIMLAFMAIPTIASISEDAISSVPQSLKNASYALGANKWQTIFFITIPAAFSGIFTAIILGISRITGETMVVLMVAGGSTELPKSIFSPIRPLTSNIAAEMAETAVGDAHYNALFAIGIILFIITFIFNIVASYLSNKYKFKSN